MPGMSGGGGVRAEGTTPEADEKVPEGAQAKPKGETLHYLRVLRGWALGLDGVGLNPSSGTYQPCHIG